MIYVLARYTNDNVALKPLDPSDYQQGPIPTVINQDENRF
jgi:hypothetical protein